MIGRSPEARRVSRPDRTVVLGEGVEPSFKAGLSRLRMPFRHPSVSIIRNLKERGADIPAPYLRQGHRLGRWAIWRSSRCFPWPLAPMVSRRSRFPLRGGATRYSRG